MNIKRYRASEICMIVFSYDHSPWFIGMMNAPFLNKPFLIHNRSFFLINNNLYLRPLAFSALYLHCPAVGFYKVFHDCKPEACAPKFPGPGRIDPEEPLTES